jgi:transcriptional regulator with XRE-family HTH domain
VAGSDLAGVDRRRQFGEFLRSRRSRMRPDEMGLPATGRRRVPGLRRDEVARLAGVSVEYYTRLEQGRGGRPSDDVLDALAGALHLNPAEREHLFGLAVPPRGTAGVPTQAELRPGIAAMVAAMSETPVVVSNRRLDVLATNRLGSLVLADLAGANGTGFRNCALDTFLNPAMRHFYVDWDDVARDVVGLLRRLTGQHPHDTRIDGLVTELMARSEDFRTMWTVHEVRQKLHGSKRMRHPLVGEIVLDYENLSLPDDPDVGLTVFTVPEGSGARRALDRLAAREPASVP